MPEDHRRHVTLPDQHEPPRPRTVRARHAASLLVWREAGGGTEVLMGMRGAKHRFMPNRLVFPGGRVDRADLGAPAASAPKPRTLWALRRNANPTLAHGLAIAAARELREETGLSLGHPPALAHLEYLARAVTPPGSPIRFNARFLCVHAVHVSGELGGDGELDNLRYWSMREALGMDLAAPTRRMLQHLAVWLALTEQERTAHTHVPVLTRDSTWAME